MRKLNVNIPVGNNCSGENVCHWSGGAVENGQENEKVVESFQGCEFFFGWICTFLFGVPEKGFDHPKRRVKLRRHFAITLFSLMERNLNLAFHFSLCSIGK